MRILSSLLVIMALVIGLVVTPGPAQAAASGDFIIYDSSGSEVERFTYDEWQAMPRTQQREHLLNCGTNCEVIRDNFGRNQNVTSSTLDMTAAQSLFLYAMGKSGSNSCISCDVLAYFMTGITKFSLVVHQYLRGAFTMLVPLMMAIWIGYRVTKLLSQGGEDGRSFLYSVVTKSALFAVIWLMVASNTTTTLGGRQAMNNPWMWETTGPVYLNSAFELSANIRDSAMAATGSGSDPFGCTGAQTSTGPVSSIVSGRINSDNTINYIQNGLEIGCVTERVHMVGMASGIAVIFSSYQGGREGDGVAERIALAIAYAIVAIFAGAMMCAVFALSCVWLTFLILDIVVRGMITAAFSPAIAAAYLWQPTRGFATNAIKGMAGALVTAIGISMVSTLAYYLLTNVIDIYNALVPFMKTMYPSLTITTITSGDMISDYSTFIERIQEDNTQKPVVPMSLATPYFYYMCLAGVCTFALGKKMIAMLEGMIGAQGFSAFADNALKMTRSSAMLGMGAAAVGGVALAATGGAMVGGTGFALQGGRRLLPGLGAAGSGAAQGAGMLTNNPWGFLAASKVGAEGMNAAQE